MGVISVMNYKGGVGKTTLSANIAADIAKEVNWRKKVFSFEQVVQILWRNSR